MSKIGARRADLADGVGADRRQDGAGRGAVASGRLRLPVDLEPERARVRRQAARIFLTVSVGIRVFVIVQTLASPAASVTWPLASQSPP